MTLTEKVAEFKRRGEVNKERIKAYWPALIRWKTEEKRAFVFGSVLPKPTLDLLSYDDLFIAD